MRGGRGARGWGERGAGAQCGDGGAGGDRRLTVLWGRRENSRRPAWLPPSTRSTPRDVRRPVAQEPCRRRGDGVDAEAFGAVRGGGRLWSCRRSRQCPRWRDRRDKTFDHPLVGPVTVDCDVLDIADRDQRVVIYTTTPG
ncbi:hypothetical protein G3I78_04875 [Streptomyces sp. SID13726]|nr:hypothetical protein [Streptomyces sp. SID13726]